MAIIGVDHIAVVVADLERALGVFGQALGLELTGIETMPDQDVRIGFLPVGGTEIELLEPIHADSGIGRYLEKRGEGLHHICLEVDDIVATLAELKGAGVQLIDESPRPGAHGQIAFIHPKGAHGVLIELVQRH